MFALPSYRGLALTVTFSKNDVTGKVPFVLGDAIGDGDVRGRLMEQLDFKGYATAPCLTQLRAPTPCVGKPLLHYIVVNVGNTPVTFAATPTITVQSTHPFTGIHQCGLATMVWADDSHLAMAWLIRPFVAIPNGKKLVFEPVAIPQLYPSGGAFTVFAIACS